MKIIFGVLVAVGVPLGVLFAIGLIAAALAPPEPPEPAGPHVVRDRFKALDSIAAAETVAQARLRDPDSARFGDEWLVVRGGPRGARVCGKVNAKNGFGAYTGAEWFYMERAGGPGDPAKVLFGVDGEVACLKLADDAKALENPPAAAVPAGPLRAPPPAGAKHPPTTAEDAQGRARALEELRAAAKH